MAECKTCPNAPHGFDRNASHSIGDYVCTCEYFECGAENLRARVAQLESELECEERRFAQLFDDYAEAGKIIEWQAATLREAKGMLDLATWRETQGWTESPQIYLETIAKINEVLGGTDNE